MYLSLEITQDIRGAEQELFVLHSVLIPPAKEYWLQSVDYALFFRKDVNGVGPELCDKLYHRMGAADDTSMRPIISSELE